MKDLSPIFSPRSIAVIGASSRPGSVGSEIMNSILRFGFTGAVYPVNPKAPAISGIRCHQSVHDIQDPVDLAILVVKRDLALPAMEQCAEAGVRSVIVITAGFREVGAEGAELERRLLEAASAAGIVMVGPNCMGAFNTDPEVKLNATFARSAPRRGPIGFISQSGAMGAAVLDYAGERSIGFSKFISIGNKSDVDENDALAAFANDDEVGVIALYLENFEDSARFREVCSRATRAKPVVVLKAGRSEAGARAASSHTGALAGSDTAVDALLRSCGALRVGSIDELLNVGKFLSVPRRPGGRRLALVTNAGGPGVIATDEFERSGFVFPSLAEETVAGLESGLPPEAACTNPCDILPGSGAEGYRVAVESITGDPNVDALVVLFLPPVMVKTKWVVEAIKPACEGSPIPVIGLFMGSGDVPADAAELEEIGVPVFNSAPEIAQGLVAARRYRRWLEREPVEPSRFEADAEIARAVLSKADGWIEAADAYALLNAYGVTAARSVQIEPDGNVAAAAQGLRYPLVMKIVSPDILHKSEVGGVELGIADRDDLLRRREKMLERVRGAQPEAAIEGLLLQEMAAGGVEMIVGIKREPGFGPLVMCGLGGVYVEVLEDVAFALAPLASDEPGRMLGRLRSAPILEGVRGARGIDRKAVAETIARVAQLAVDFPAIGQLDINPLMAGPDGCLAVDVRISVSTEGGE